MNADFQTPLWVCDYMVMQVPSGSDHILEPTPGSGNLVRALRNQSYTVTAPGEFWSLEPNAAFDCIVMNPPFSPMSVGYEILYRCMDYTANIVALMPWLTLINSQVRTRKIVDWGLKEVAHLPRYVFPGSRVQCCILTMRKGWREGCQLKFLQMRERGEKRWR